MTRLELETELQRGAKFVVYRYCISIIILTFRRSSPVHFLPAGQNRIRHGLVYSLISFLLGWWGIPWGPIYTIESLVVNFRGGKDVTAEITMRPETKEDIHVQSS